MHRIATSTLKIVSAFAAIYIIWGSTYLAIHFAIDTMPSYFMTSFRFFLAGLMLLAWARFRGEPFLDKQYWKSAAIIGTLMLFGGMGTVAFAQQWVPSGLTALIIAMVPVWMVLIETFRPNGTRPGPRVWLGIVISFIGLVLLIGLPDISTDAGGYQLLGAGLIVLATLNWSIGSIYSRSAKAPPSPMMFTAMQMLFASAPLLAAGLIRGEVSMINFDAISMKSILAWLYLIVFGSVIALTAYIWLLKVSDPARVGTYAYVNPVIAVALGWAFNGEILSTQTLIGAALIIAAVIIIISRQQRPKKQEKSESQPEPKVDTVQCAEA